MANCIVQTYREGDTLFGNYFGGLQVISYACLGIKNKAQFAVCEEKAQCYKILLGEREGFLVEIYCF